MARSYVGPRLYQRCGRPGRPEIWVIRDGQIEISTRCTDLESAQVELEKYCQEHGKRFTRPPASSERRHPRTMVYFITTDEVADYPVKIGLSDRGAERRMADVQNGCPFKLTVLLEIEATRSLERELHAKFAHIRLQREWFQRTPELLAEIEKLRGAMRKAA